MASSTSSDLSNEANRRIDCRPKNTVLPYILGLRPLQLRIHTCLLHLYLTHYSGMDCNSCQYVMPDLLLLSSATQKSKSKFENRIVRPGKRSDFRIWISIFG